MDCSTCMDQHTANLTGHIRALQAELDKRQWRTIDEAPPEEGIYLAWQTIPPSETPDGIDRSGPTILAWVDGDSYNGWGVAYVTHWTPLPEPPK